MRSGICSLGTTIQAWIDIADVIEEFRSYAEVRAKYYGKEQRWPANEFWRRRQAELSMDH